jgi:hypothetical protein
LLEGTENHEEYFMGNVNPETEEGLTAGNNEAGEERLQGGELNSSAQQNPATGAEDESECDADSELHLDGDAGVKADTLYRDGIDLDEDYDTLAGTRGSSGTIP